MFQDIAPQVLDTRYRLAKAQRDDYLIVIKKRQILMINSSSVKLPTLRELYSQYQFSVSPLYLLSVGGRRFFYLPASLSPRFSFSFQKLTTLVKLSPGWLAFGAVTAVHLAAWYAHHHFCGRCRKPLKLGRRERKLVCPRCGLTVFPTISPAVIVGVKHKNQLLLTKYARGFSRFALIAGFCEIGETLEDTVRREVFEETGLKVTHITYYKSQPWGFSRSLLAGFFADVARKAPYSTWQFRPDPKELATARWFSAPDLPVGGSFLSLTREMIAAFKGHR